MTYISVCGAISGIIVGYIGDHVSNRMLLLQLSIVVSGLTNLCFPLFKTYGQLVGYSILSGVSLSFQSVVAVIPSDLVPLEEVVNAWGLYSLISGPTASAGGPFGGIMNEHLMCLNRL